mmetsp:Transcript_2143/g.6329  ORF Transcript_2143/g.6329 Transcript_2143/m.6329 type:complete len:329 (+) Transcript_2143:702-1688(+)
MESEAAAIGDCLPQLHEDGGVPPHLAHEGAEELDVEDLVVDPGYAQRDVAVDPGLVAGEDAHGLLGLQPHQPRLVRLRGRHDGEAEQRVPRVQERLAAHRAGSAGIPQLRHAVQAPLLAPRPGAAPAHEDAAAGRVALGRVQAEAPPPGPDGAREGVQLPALAPLRGAAAAQGGLLRGPGERGGLEAPPVRGDELARLPPVGPVLGPLRGPAAPLHVEPAQGAHAHPVAALHLVGRGVPPRQPRDPPGAEAAVELALVLQVADRVRRPRPRRAVPLRTAQLATSFSIRGAVHMVEVAAGVRVVGVDKPAEISAAGCSEVSRFQAKVRL